MTPDQTITLHQTTIRLEPDRIMTPDHTITQEKTSIWLEPDQLMAQQQIIP